MKALELYTAVLRELDRYSSPTFEIGDFNYFVMKAVDKILDDGISDFVERKIVSDALKHVRVFAPLTLNPTDSTDVRSTGLPADFRKEANVLLLFRYAKDFGCNKKGEKVSYPAKELTGDMEPTVMNNFYHRPLVNRPYYVISGRDISIRYDSAGKANTDVLIEKIDLEYFRNPKGIELGEDFETVDGKDSEFPEKVNRNIIETCTMLFLENTQNRRVQTNLQVNEIKKSE